MTVSADASDAAALPSAPEPLLACPLTSFSAAAAAA
eukprot:CAMPEP_0115508500 /NCGR_PEP_ID=MMETSP0271-20121206/72333_1 /TAXON_ID=71861 /ORGANISM="Scrippsiella trochoidea, Strain CCMP3099" /LENGTH=35 /DNA_ID= /DNA_START= /DNA_END= /DNA_ORIENTATION=